MKIPFLISVPHAGISIPEEIEDLNLIGAEQIVKDGDEGALEIYDLKDEVNTFVTTDIARAYIDMNRSADDLSPDGVVKTETIFKERIYRQPLDKSRIKLLLDNYYYPYHAMLQSSSKGNLMGIDCHTMLSESPPISSLPGIKRPKICLSNAGETCSENWLSIFAGCLEIEFGFSISINYPFMGGHIIRSHASELPWMQLELSREEFMSYQEKKEKLIKAILSFYKKIK